jgi:uncharacterized protein (TIGR02466 family)
METKYEVIPIFPTLLYTNKVPEQLVKDHTDFLNQEEIIDLNNNHYGSRSKNSYLFHKKKYKNLSKYILQHVVHYSENYLSYNYQNYKFSQSWVSVKFPHQEHKTHTHSFSLISGVLFYGDSFDKTSHISFHRKDTISKDFKSNVRSKLVNQFSSTTYEIFYKPNLMVLFPSNLAHSVSKNITDIPRKSISFNVVPKEGFGSEENLNELKFNN